MHSGVRFLVEGSMPERFIAQALAAGVHIRQCRRTDARHMELLVRRQDAARLQQLAEGFHLRSERLGEAGTARLAENLVRRRTALLGFVAMVCTASLLLSRIWLVEVRPVDDAQPALLEKAAQILAGCGARPGASAWGLDRAQLRSRLISALPEAGYVSVRRRGVCLAAEVSQAVAPPEVYDIGAARDVVALYDGVVQRVDVFAGTAAVQPGDAVRRGDVLIRGEERTSGEFPAAVAAEGVVMARIWQTAEAQEPLHRTETTLTGRSSRGEVLRILKWSVPLTEPEAYETARARRGFLPVGGLFLPVGIERTVYEECIERRAERPKAELEQALMQKTEAILDENMPFDARVIDKWSDYSMIDSGALYMKLTRELEADIAASGRNN